MPEDVPLKVEAWPIERVIAYASSPRKRSAVAVDGLAASISVALRRSALRRRPRPVQQLPAPHRSVSLVRRVLQASGRCAED
jgi:hypothetical protein